MCSLSSRSSHTFKYVIKHTNLIKSNTKIIENESVKRLLITKSRASNLFNFMQLTDL